MTAVEETARELSIKVLRLDTNRALPEARQLYQRTGWTEIDRLTTIRIRTHSSKSGCDHL